MSAKQEFHQRLDRVEFTPGPVGDGSDTLLYEYLTEFYQTGRPDRRYGKTEEHKRIAFFDPEDRKMLEWHGYGNVWDSLELPQDILIGIEQRRGTWRVKTIQPADERPAWAVHSSGLHYDAQWIKGSALQVGMALFTPMGTIHHLVKWADEQRKDTGVLWVMFVEDAHNYYPERTYFYHHDYWYLTIPEMDTSKEWEMDPLQEMRETV